MELPPEYQIIASIIVGIVIIGGAVAKYVRDMRRGAPAIITEDMAEVRRLIERRDDHERTEELTSQIRQLAGAIDNHRRQMQDLGRSVEAVASALNRRT